MSSSPPPSSIDTSNLTIEGPPPLATPKGSTLPKMKGSLLWSPSAVWPWTASSFDSTSLRSPPPPLYSSSDEEDEEEEEYSSSNSSSSPASTRRRMRRRRRSRVQYHTRDPQVAAAAAPSPHTRLLLRDTRDRITSDYMLLLRASVNGGSLPPLVLSSGLSRDPVVKTSRSWRVEAQHDTAIQKTLDCMRIRQAEYHRKLEAAIMAKSEQHGHDKTCEKLTNLLRQLQGLSDKVGEASAMIEQRWRGRIAWQRQKRVDAALAKAARKRKLAFQKGGILQRDTHDSLLTSVEEEEEEEEVEDMNTSIESNDGGLLFTKELPEDTNPSLLVLSEDHWSYFEQYLRLDTIDVLPKGDMKRKRALLARCLMDLHTRAKLDIQKVGGCSEALLMLIEEESSLDEDPHQEEEEEDITTYYDEEHQVLAKYREVLDLAAQRMHILLCTMKALMWEKGLRRYQRGNTRNVMVSSFEEDTAQWFDSELEVAKLSAQEYSHLCVDHIRELLSSVDTYQNDASTTNLLAEVESAVEAYRHRLTALSEFLTYSEAPVGSEGLPVLWLLHELEQLRRNSSSGSRQIREHLGEDIDRACALVRLILLTRPSGEYYDEELMSSNSRMKGTPSCIDDKAHSGSIIIHNDKENWNMDNNIIAS